jgi:hypothetical protein
MYFCWQRLEARPTFCLSSRWARVVRRGHDAVVIARENLRGIIGGAGLGFEPIGTAEEYRRLAGDPRAQLPCDAILGSEHDGPLEQPATLIEG